MAVRYFKRRWDETRGDDHDHWGASWWFFACDAEGVIVRQVEEYDAGPTLRYDVARPTGPHGALGDQPLELEE